MRVLTIFKLKFKNSHSYSCPIMCIQCIHTPTRRHTCTHTCMHTNIHPHTDTCMYITHTHAHAHIHTCMYVCIETHTHMHRHMYTYTHYFVMIYRKIDMTNVTISPIGEAGHTNEFEIK